VSQANLTDSYINVDSSYYFHVILPRVLDDDYHVDGVRLPSLNCGHQPAYYPSGSTNKLVLISECKLVLLLLPPSLSRFGGVVVSVLATGPKGRSFECGQGDLPLG
jgi:hypothetical protein